jgi:hypothetical protein
VGTWTGLRLSIILVINLINAENLLYKKFIILL